MPRKKKAPSQYIQLDLIPPTELEKLYAEFKEVKESADKVRRGIFAKNTDLAKKVQDLTCEIESLQKQIITLSEWMITQIGRVSTVPSIQGTDHNLTRVRCPLGIMEYAEYVEENNPSHTQEVLDSQILSA